MELPTDVTEEIIEVSPHIVEAIERIVKKATKVSPNGLVEIEKDWDLVIDIYYYWRTLFPEQYGWFIEEIQDYREAHRDNKGIVDEEDSTKLQFVMQMPEKLWELLKSAFPSLKLDREFRDEFIKRLPEFKVV